MDDIVRAFLENEQKLRLVERLGRGGFGEVWAVESPSGVRSAIKVSLDPIDGENPAVKKELENLKLVKALIGHPHIVSLLDYWVVSDYLVTRWELATDGDLLGLWERYREEGQPGIPVEQLIQFISEAADALDFLHGKGIYHRDIKPRNLLLFHGHVKIADLGLLKLVGASTASHTGSGTFGYLPPEAWQDHRLTSTADLYSLAATYVKLRTGNEPFGTNPVEILARQQRGEPILDGLEAYEKALLLAALDPDPEKRPSEGRNWVRWLYEARVSSSGHAKGQDPVWASATAETVPQSREGGTSDVAAPISPGTYVAIQSPGGGAFSPDGRRIVTASSDNTAIVWDAQTGERLRVLRGHNDWVYSTAFSPDGRRIVTASSDNTAIVWDAQMGERLLVLQGHRNSVNSAAFSPDGRRIVTASSDNTAIVWHARTGESLLVLQGHNGSVYSAAFSPGGQRIVTASIDNTAMVWDARTGERLLVLQGHNDWVYSAVFSPDGRRIVTASSSDDTAIVWDAETGERLLVLQGHNDAVYSAVFSPDGQRIVTASVDNTAIVWDARTGKRLLVLQGHNDAVYSAAFSPDGRRIVTGSIDNTVIVWDAETGEMLLKSHVKEFTQEDGDTLKGTDRDAVKDETTGDSIGWAIVGGISGAIVGGIGGANDGGISGAIFGAIVGAVGFGILGAIVGAIGGAIGGTNDKSEIQNKKDSQKS